MTISNSLHKYVKNPLITGTILLTAAGLLSRIIGFFYKIFLSRAIGAESLGLYHLTFPVLSLFLSLTSSGIQTALSRFVAEEKNTPRRAMRFFYVALFLSCGLSVLGSIILQQNADWIAVSFLGDERCSSLLVIMAYTFLPAAVHSCINGYYFGLKKAQIPSISQLVEQIARVGGVYLMYQIQMERGGAITAVHAVWGTLIGELFGLIYSVTAMWLQRNIFEPRKNQRLGATHHPSNTHTAAIHQRSGSSVMLTHRRALWLLCGMAVPLTFNRVLINLCTSVENMLIPKRLCLSGLNISDALSVYGVLSGMAMSIILFPNVVTGSLSVLLLPAVSEAKADGRENSIISATKKAIRYGLLLGFGFTFLFLLSGDFLGTVIFNSPLAGQFIRRLSWLCPFMYVTGMLSSILHGLGRPKTVLLINLLSCLMRIIFVWFLVPQYGINAYLWSMLVSQVFCAVASIVPLRRYL